MRPTLVVFDVGGVLVELDMEWSQGLGIDPAVANAWLQESDAYHELECGRLGEEAFAITFAKVFGIESAGVCAAFSRNVRRIFPGTPQLLQDLRVPCATLSNSNTIHWRVFDPERTIRSAMQHTLASQYLGARKPDPEIFDRANQIFGKQAILYLDDKEENVAAARRAGWVAERVYGTAAVREVLSAAGVLASCTG